MEGGGGPAGGTCRRTHLLVSYTEQRWRRAGRQLAIMLHHHVRLASSTKGALWHPQCHPMVMARSLSRCRAVKPAGEGTPNLTHFGWVDRHGVAAVAVRLRLGVQRGDMSHRCRVHTGGKCTGEAPPQVLMCLHPAPPHTPPTHHPPTHPACMCLYTRNHARAHSHTRTMHTQVQDRLPRPLRCGRVPG